MLNLAGAAFDAAEFLDIDVDELARPRALVSARRLESQQSKPIEAFAGQIPETLDSAIPGVSAISAPLKRSRRNAGITFTRSLAVRFATPAGPRRAG